MSVRGFFAAAVLVAAGLPCARADHIWYNGDFNGVNGLSNEQNTTVNTYGRTYDNFSLSTSTVITRVFSNDLMTSAFSTTAYWEIRSGVSVGNGGTLVASGTNADTVTATGRSGFGLNEYTVSVDGLNVTLGPGTYWLTCVPIDSGSGRSFVSTTSGANSIGLLPGNSFFDSPFFNVSFGNAGDQLGGGAFDFSMGVDGHAAVPAPAGVQLGIIGAAVALTGYYLRRFRARKAIPVC
jgi:hypothetical protein